MAKAAKILLFIFFLFNIVIVELEADTVYLKNGRSLEGLIDKEDDERVVLDLGFGMVTFRRQEIKDIYRSSPDEVKKIYKEWEGEKELEKERWVKIEKAREEARRKKEFEPKEVEFFQDAGHIVVDAWLNRRVKAALLLDTGASILLLSSRIAEELGIDIYESEKEFIEVQLADGTKVDAKHIVLDSVSVEGVEAKEIEAVVLKDETDMDMRDGLLGMSFLNKFNFQIDTVKKKLILRKLEK
ncbi:MAG: retroviral-like aspartic protease family protein [Candidatus Omnitrophica bacterium]|nr:retroviral-like aspartic protease family protein [Candidatus Omnitrophota bacterium]